MVLTLNCTESSILKMAFWAGTMLSVLIMTLTPQPSFALTNNTFYKVTTILEKPYTMIADVSATTTATRYQGYIIDLLQMLKTILNIDFDIDLVADGRYGGISEDGNWTGLIGHLVPGEADIAAAPLYVLSTRAKSVEFSQMYMLSGPQILMKKPQATPVSKFLMLLQPFSTGVWLTALVAHLIVSLALYAIWRWSPFEWGIVATGPDRELRDSLNLQNSFLFAFSTMLNQGYRVAPRSLSGRLLAAVWWIFAMFLLVAYTASLTGRFIIKPTTEKDIKTFDDLALSSMSYGAIRNGKIANLFKTSADPLRRKMWDKMMADPSNLTPSLTDGIQKVRGSNGDYAFIMETPLAEYAASKEPCDLMVTGERLTDDGYAFACRKGSNICNGIDHALLKLKESTQLHDLRRKWFGGTCAREEERVKQDTFVSPKTTFSLQDTAFVYVFLAIGIVASLIALGVEIFLNTKGIVVPSSYKEDEMRINDPKTDM